MNVILNQLMIINQFSWIKALCVIIVCCFCILIYNRLSDKEKLASLVRVTMLLQNSKIFNSANKKVTILWLEDEKFACAIGDIKQSFSISKRNWMQLAKIHITKSKLQKCIPSRLLYETTKLILQEYEKYIKNKCMYNKDVKILYIDNDDSIVYIYGDKISNFTIFEHCVQCVQNEIKTELQKLKESQLVTNIKMNIKNLTIKKLKQYIPSKEQYDKLNSCAKINY